MTDVLLTIELAAFLVFLRNVNAAKRKMGVAMRISAIEMRKRKTRFPE